MHIDIGNAYINDAIERHERFKKPRADDAYMPGLNKKPRNNKYAKLVTFTSIQDVKKSALNLEKEFRTTPIRSKRLLIKQTVNYASNRAIGKAKEKNISPTTRQRYAEISKIYRDLFNRLKFIESTCS